MSAISTIRRAAGIGASRCGLALALGLFGAAAWDGAARAQSDADPAKPHAQAIDPGPLLRLGDLYANGSAVARDPKKAIDYYSQAAAAGSDEGAIHVGEMLARGDGVTADVDAGRRKVQEVADRGDVSAMLSLGDLYSTGDAGKMEESKAISAYRAAAMRGSISAMLKLGDLFEGGRFDVPKEAMARQYYCGAAETGDPYALLAIANFASEGHRGCPGDRRKPLDLAKMADAGAVDAAKVALANMYFYALGTPRDVAKALSILKAAGDAGNKEAAIAYVGAYRDGRKDNRVALVRRDLDKARAAVNGFAAALGAAQSDIERFLIDAVTAPKERFPEFYARLRALPGTSQAEIVRRLPDVESNLYVYAAQARLRELGAFKGEPNGLLDSATVRAVNDRCAVTGTRYICSFRPMSGATAELLSYAFEGGADSSPP